MVERVRIEFWFPQLERRLYSSEEMRVEKLTAAARFKLKLCLLTNLRSFLWIVDYFSVDSTQNMFKSWQSAICIFDNQNWRGGILKLDRRKAVLIFKDLLRHTLGIDLLRLTLGIDLLTLNLSIDLSRLTLFCKKFGWLEDWSNSDSLSLSLAGSMNNKSLGMGS